MFMVMYTSLHPHKKSFSPMNAAAISASVKKGPPGKGPVKSNLFKSNSIGRTFCREFYEGLWNLISLYVLCR